MKTRLAGIFSLTLGCGGIGIALSLISRVLSTPTHQPSSLILVVVFIIFYMVINNYVPSPSVLQLPLTPLSLDLLTLACFFPSLSFLPHPSPAVRVLNLQPVLHLTVDILSDEPRTFLTNLTFLPHVDSALSIMSGHSHTRIRSDFNILSVRMNKIPPD